MNKILNMVCLAIYSIFQKKILILREDLAQMNVSVYDNKIPSLVDGSFT